MTVSEIAVLAMKARNEAVEEAERALDCDSVSPSHALQLYELSEYLERHALKLGWRHD